MYEDSEIRNLIQVNAGNKLRHVEMTLSYLRDSMSTVLEVCF